MNHAIRFLGEREVPRDTGLRIMMMPFRLDDPGTVPFPVAKFVANVVRLGPCQSGVGYLTVDDALVRAGETHRRPGLHVDGSGLWGGPGPGGSWGARGMLVAASHLGSRAWDQEVDGSIGPDGECERLRTQLQPEKERRLWMDHVYWLSPRCVHEGLPMKRTTRRTFIRISMPSEAPWFDGYTPSPFGVMPTGPILPARVAQMGYRP